ncbi:hypothetical protein O1M54_01165 [Streptomyces diastatochromogenes]|nr:hypothetical protein [Streptomyces diastatochromogenes]
MSDALRRAGRVLVIAGEEVAAANARTELAELARRLGAWVAVTPDAKDVFDNRDPRFAGVAGVMGHANVEDCLRRADLCLLVGTRLPHLRAAASTGPWPPPRSSASAPNHRSWQAPHWAGTSGTR